MNNQKSHLVPIGIVMIIIQLIGCFGNGSWGVSFSFANFAAFAYSLFYFIGSWFVGILGLIFVLIGLFSKPKGERDDDDDWD